MSWGFALFYELIDQRPSLIRLVNRGDLVLKLLVVAFKDAFGPLRGIRDALSDLHVAQSVKQVQLFLYHFL